MDEKQLSQLIGSIYDASLNSELWDEVLKNTAEYLMSATATLGSFDLVHRDTNFHKAWGYDPNFLELLLNRFIKNNPMNFSAALTKVGDVHAIGDLLPYDEFYASAMYLEWGKPQGYVDAIQATLEKTPTAVAFLHCIRHVNVGMVDDEMRRRLSLLWPHFRRAVLIGKVIDLRRVEADTFADTLDGLSAAMFLVDRCSRIVHTNKRARTMLQERCIVKSDRGEFSVTDPIANKTLHEIIALSHDGDDAVGTRGITVPLAPPDSERHLAHLLPLTSGERRQAGLAYSSVAAVFVRKAALDGPIPAEALVAAFRLTPAELRVLLAIVEIGGVPDVASTLGISEATVKTHLKHVFDKTGTRRQSDLAKLVASFTGPVGQF
jgi:DNA-binding CsgD family transcriptional regulator